MRIGEEIQRREKEQRIVQIYTDISYYRKLKETTKVTEYRYPPFDRGERETSKAKVTPKQNTKKCEKKNQSLYTGSLNSIESFSTEKLSK